MMIATNFGVYEIGVRYEDDRQGKIRGDRTMQIRARRVQDLIKLRERFCPGLGKIHSTPKRDWPYRVYCTRAQVREVMAAIADSINYEFFKQDAEDEDLHHSLDRMWAAHLRVFPKGSVYGRIYRNDYAS